MGLTCEGALTELARALTLSFWPWLRALRKLHAPGIARVRLCYTTHLPTCRMPFQRALGVCKHSSLVNSLNPPLLPFSPTAARCPSAAMRWWPSPIPSPGSTPTSPCCRPPWSTLCARQPPSSSGCSPAHCRCSGSCPWKR